MKAQVLLAGFKSNDSLFHHQPTSQYCGTVSSSKPCRRKSSKSSKTVTISDEYTIQRIPSAKPNLPQTGEDLVKVYDDINDSTAVPFFPKKIDATHRYINKSYTILPGKRGVKSKFFIPATGGIFVINKSYTIMPQTFSESDQSLDSSESSQSSEDSIVEKKYPADEEEEEEEDDDGGEENLILSADDIRGDSEDPLETDRSDETVTDAICRVESQHPEETKQSTVKKASTVPSIESTRSSAVTSSCTRRSCHVGEVKKFDNGISSQISRVTSARPRATWVIPINKQKIRPYTAIPPTLKKLSTNPTSDGNSSAPDPKKMLIRGNRASVLRQQAAILKAQIKTTTLIRPSSSIASAEPQSPTSTKASTKKISRKGEQRHQKPVPSSGFVKKSSPILPNADGFDVLDSNTFNGLEDKIEVIKPPPDGCWEEDCYTTDPTCKTEVSVKRPASVNIPSCIREGHPDTFPTRPVSSRNYITPQNGNSDSQSATVCSPRTRIPVPSHATRANPCKSAQKKENSVKDNKIPNMLLRKYNLSKIGKDIKASSSN